MIVYGSNCGFDFKGSPFGRAPPQAVRGHKCVSKALSVTLTRDTSPGVRGFQLVYFTPVNSRLSFDSPCNEVMEQVFSHGRSWEERIL